MTGSTMLGITLAGVLYLHGSAAPTSYRLFLMIPATISAAGFAQAQSHFCAYFGLAGLFNMEAAQPSETPQQAEFRRQDRKKAWQIIDLSLGIGAFVTFLACWWR